MIKAYILPEERIYRRVPMASREFTAVEYIKNASSVLKTAKAYTLKQQLQIARL